MILKRFERAGSAQGFSPSNSSPAARAVIHTFEGYGVKSIHHARKDCDLPPGSPAKRSSDREALKDLREPPVELLRAFEQWEVAGMRQHYRVEVSDDAPDCLHIGWKAVAVDAPYGHAQPPRGHSRIVPAESPEHRADGVQRHSGHAPPHVFDQRRSRIGMQQHAQHLLQHPAGIPPPEQALCSRPISCALSRQFSEKRARSAHRDRRSDERASGVVQIRSVQCRIAP